MWLKRLTRVLSALFFLVGITAILSVPSPAKTESQPLDDENAVYMLALNVGKADCFLIKAEGKNFLIDTGYEQTSGLMMTALEQMGVTHLSGVFITHNHKDHVGGLERLVQSDIAIDAFYTSAYCLDPLDNTHPAVIAAAKRGQTVRFLRGGDSIPVTDTLSFSILGPLERNADNENNNSLVMVMRTAQGNILLTGDMKNEEEYTLLKAGVFEKCEVLKVPFHGDDTATSSAMLKIVQPRMSIVSTSTLDEPDTPSQSTLRALAMAGSETHVTQDVKDAILVILKDRKAVAKEVTWTLPEKISTLTLSMKLSKDVIYVKNTGNAPVSMDGMELFSTRGEDLFELPAGVTIPSGGEISIASSNSGTSADIVLTSKKRIWHKSKYDQAILYDAYGRAIARTDNGMPE